MGHIDKELLLDCSTPDKFCFSLRCECCGEVWKSKSVRFSKAGTEPDTPGKRIIFDALYKWERETALGKAVIEAEKVFSRCPICHSLVCDHCFLVCEDLDMCVSCADMLKETGEPVMKRETG